MSRQKELNVVAGNYSHVMVNAVNWTKLICLPLKWMVVTIVLNAAKKAVAF